MNVLPRVEMADLELAGKRVLIREDLNVPLKDGAVANDARIQAALPTLRAALAAGAGVIVMSHLGRPEEGKVDPAASLAPVAAVLSEALEKTVPLIATLEEAAPEPGEIVLLENVRFLSGEKKDDEALARRLAGICDVFVMDAFATAHRAQASTHGVARFAPIACAGPIFSPRARGNGLFIAPSRAPAKHEGY